MDSAIFRQIPKMDRLLEGEAVRAAAEDLPRAEAREAVRKELDRLRKELADGAAMPGERELDLRLAGAVRRAGQPRLRRVVNATGIVLHTNLGRAPLSAGTAAHVAETAAGYSNLEYDLETGGRGSRNDLAEELLCRVTGAEAALVVNNNAAAVFLMLNTHARGKKVAVSRGELVEIGGAFRVPEIMRASGADLMEIGTTNKTHPEDYRRALENGAQAILKVHTSNFRVTGFAASVEAEELAGLAEEYGVPLFYDLGSALPVRKEMLGLPEGIFAGDAAPVCDVCCFSGDKLFGAGQAGIVLGRAEAVAAMKKNQLSRILRVDKMTLAALEDTARWYLDPEQALEKVPVLRMLRADAGRLRQDAEHMAERLARICPSCAFAAVPCTDAPGGGALPGVELPGWAVAVSHAARSANELEEFLRGRDRPVIARIRDGRLLLSVRTVLPEDGPAVEEAFRALEKES